MKWNEDHENDNRIVVTKKNFMKDIVHKSYKIDDEKIKIFPHFIQE